MDIQSLLASLQNMLPTSPQNQTAQPQIQNSQILNTYPNSYIDSPNTTIPQTKQQGQTPTQNNLAETLLSSLFNTQAKSSNPIELLSSMLKSNKKNSPQFCELKSIDEYTFD